MSTGKRVSWVALAAVAFLCATVDGAAQKMKADALVALHLKAIGEDPVRKNRVAQGLGTVDIRVGNKAKMVGPAMLLAEGNKLRTEIKFGHPQYAGETLIRNGDKAGHCLRQSRRPLPAGEYALGLLPPSGPRGTLRRDPLH